MFFLWKIFEALAERLRRMVEIGMPVDVVFETAPDEYPLPGAEENPGKTFLVLALMESDLDHFLNSTGHLNRWQRIQGLMENALLDRPHWYATLEAAIRGRFEREGELLDLDDERDFTGFQQATRHVDTTPTVTTLEPGGYRLNTWKVRRITEEPQK